MADDRIKVGFVGCGGISRSLYTGVYAGLAEIAQVVAVADLADGLAETRSATLKDAYRAEAFRAKVEAADAHTPEAREAATKKAEAAESASTYDIRKYRDHEELLKDDEVELVCVFTPPVIRAVPIVAAAEAGRHVYAEGPMAKSVEEADAIVAAVRKAGIKFHSQVVDRYPRGMLLAHLAVERGLLGQIGSANVEMHTYRDQEYYGPVGGVGVDFRPRSWHGAWEGEGGGAVFHHGRYIIDPFLWVVGSRVAEVFAYSWPALRQIEHDSLTQAVVRFENGATGTIHATLISHLDGHIPGRRGRITILGRDAAIEIDQESDPPNLVNSRTVIASNDNPAAAAGIEALRNELLDHQEHVTQQDQTRLFLESIANDTEPLVPIEIPHHHVEVTRAIYKSAAEGQPVTLPLDKDDPFYGFEGRLKGTATAGPLSHSMGHPFATKS